MYFCYCTVICTPPMKIQTACWQLLFHCFLCVIVPFLLVVLWGESLQGFNQILVLPPDFLSRRGVHSWGRFKEGRCTVTLYLHEYLSIFKTWAAAGAGAVIASSATPQFPNAPQTVSSNVGRFAASVWFHQWRLSWRILVPPLLLLCSELHQGSCTDRQRSLTSRLP